MDLTVDNLLFNYETTYRADYRFGDIPPHNEYKHGTEKPPPPTKKFVRVDNETLYPYKEGKPVPFSLLHRPKEIIHTNPNEKPQPIEKPKDLGLEEAIRTRPRCYMTPVICLDDIKDKEKRQILIDYTYTSEKKNSDKDTIIKKVRVEAPVPERPAPANIVKLPNYDVYPEIPSEWHEEAMKWDARQTRAYVEPTKRFWQQKAPTMICGACDQNRIKYEQLMDKAVQTAERLCDKYKP